MESFEKWMTHVENWVQKIACVGIYDLPDARFADEYQAGTTPREMAMRMLHDEGFPDWDVTGEEDDD